MYRPLLDYLEKLQCQTIPHWTASQEELYTWLYNFCKAQDDAEKTFEDVFMILEDKKRRDGRTDQTLREDKRHFGFLSEGIRNKVITEITEDELRDWLVSDYMPERPK